MAPWDPRHPKDKNPERWARMNEGQRRYANEQWRLARLRRGHYTPNPYTENAEQVVNEIFTGGGPSTPASPAESLDLAAYGADGSPPGLDDIQLSPQPGPHNQLVPYIEPRQQQSLSIPSHILSTNMDTAMAVDSTSGAGAGSSSRNPKRSRGGGAAAPGTAAGASGDGGGIGGASESGGVMEIPRPMQYKASYQRTFRKQFKFLTFGIAPNIISESQFGGGTNVYFTTALASIPVHKLVLYMSPQEFGLMQPGETCTMLKVKVVQRNVRVAFETASSSSGTATLNQNKNGMFAIGLNKTGYGVDSRYTAFDATETMKPTALTAAAIIASTTLYGENNNGATFATNIPAHPFGVPVGLSNYWTSSTNLLYSGGWPNLQDHIHLYDAADAVGQEIVEYTYSPKVGILKADPWPRLAGNPYRGPTTGIPVTLPNTVIPTHRDLQFEVSQITMEAPGASAPGATSNGSISHQNFDLEADNQEAGHLLYTSDIEKSGRWVNGIHTGGGVSIQPTLHVGVEPVPKLTTPDLINNAVPDKWTDVQSYFDVSTEIHTEWRMCAERQYPNANNDSDITFATRRFRAGGTRLDGNTAASTLMGRLTTDNRNAAQT